CARHERGSRGNYVAWFAYW
nr:immunoglobulin heavy chain junction region [Mus musculus]